MNLQFDRTLCSMFFATDFETVFCFVVIIFGLIVWYFNSPLCNSQQVFRLLANTLSDRDEKYPVFDVRFDLYDKKSTIRLSSTKVGDEDEMLVHVEEILGREGFHISGADTTGTTVTYRASNIQTKQQLSFRILETSESSKNKNSFSRDFLIEEA